MTYSHCLVLHLLRQLFLIPTPKPLQMRLVVEAVRIDIAVDWKFGTNLQRILAYFLFATGY